MCIAGRKLNLSVIWSDKNDGAGIGFVPGSVYMSTWAVKCLRW